MPIFFVHLLVNPYQLGTPADRLTLCWSTYSWIDTLYVDRETSMHVHCPIYIHVSQLTYTVSRLKYMVHMLINILYVDRETSIHVYCPIYICISINIYSFSIEIHGTYVDQHTVCWSRDINACILPNIYIYIYMYLNWNIQFLDWNTWYICWSTYCMLIERHQRMYIAQSIYMYLNWHIQFLDWNTWYTCWSTYCWLTA